MTLTMTTNVYILYNIMSYTNQKFYTWYAVTGDSEFSSGQLYAYRRKRQMTHMIYIYV